MVLRARSAGAVADLNRPQYRPEPEGNPTPDLFTHLEAETWLADRLLQHGCDLYAGGPYATYVDRLGACIVRNGVQCVVVGRKPAGKPENYAQLFERIAGKPLPKKVDAQINTKLNTGNT